jgi:drug/metabolite transporter (DMT)-like permease
VAALVLLPLVWRDLRRKWPIIAAHRNLIILLGVLQVGSSTVLFVAVNFTTAINAALISAAQPALTIIPAWFLTRDRATANQCLGIFAAFLGIAVMVTQANLRILLSLELNVGDILTLAAILGWTFYATLLHRLPHNLGHTTSLFLICLTGALSLVPFYAYESAALRTVPFTATAIAVIVVLAVLVSAVSVLFWNLAIRSVGPNRATIFTNLIPVFGVVLAINFLGERLFTYHIIGVAFVVLGVVLVIFRTHRRSKSATEP